MAQTKEFFEDVPKNPTNEGIWGHL